MGMCVVPRVVSWSLFAECAPNTGVAPASSVSEATTRVEPLVYLDNQRMGGINFLRDIPVTEIFEIRYHTAAQAQIKWGNGHAQGVIQIRTARTSTSE